jgi:hypothetical protein
MIFSTERFLFKRKPFIICCCGPFAANVNDASILKRILETDTDFRNIVPNKSLIILDRGKSNFSKFAFYLFNRIS